MRTRSAQVVEEFLKGQKGNSGKAYETIRGGSLWEAIGVTGVSAKTLATMAALMVVVIVLGICVGNAASSGTRTVVRGGQMEAATSMGTGSGGSGATGVAAGVTAGGGGGEEDAGRDAAAATIYVHVAGAVVLPGLYGLEAGARVDDAVKAAGGPLEDADLGAVNLAQPLEDGCKVTIPGTADRLGQTGVPTVEYVEGPLGQEGHGGLVNINKATVETLCGLPGIGEATARAIVRDREENGPYESTYDLTRVSGIGQKKYESIADLVCV